MDERREIRALPRPVDTASAIEEALQLLAPLGLRPVLIGGVALGVHGIERYTKNVDLALTLAEVGKSTPVVQEHDPRPLRIGGLSFATRSGVRVDLIDRRVGFSALYKEAITEARRGGFW